MDGRSHAASTWVGFDARQQQEVLLCVPRTQPTDEKERGFWTEQALGAARLKHPRIAEALEVGVHEGWPFASITKGSFITLSERLTSGGSLPPLEVVTLACDVLEGLAYAHEAGVVHRDIGPHTVLIDKNGRGQIAGLSCASLPALPPGVFKRRAPDTQEIRKDAERDLLMVGLLMYKLLTNAWALDDNDLGSAAERVGPEIVRLPFNTPHPVPDTLRAIVNRATDRQQRQRYLNARTLLSALQGWIKTNSQDAGGPLALLLDRLNSVGALPGRPNMERAVANVLNQDKLRVDDFVDVILQNPTLSWELLRSVNGAAFSSHSADEGVTTLSRAVVLLGQQGLRRVMGAVRAWPGALGAQASLSDSGDNPAARELNIALHQACVAGAVARLLAPFSISDEEASVAAMSQSLGWLLILYHFPDEAEQIKRLMQPGPPPEKDAPPTPGMTQEAAAGAVLGINIDELTVAVLKHWGLHERLQQAARSFERNAPVRTPKSPEEILRTVACLANELAATLRLETPKAVSALHQIHMRYARPLALDPKECQIALEKAQHIVDARPIKTAASA